MALRHTVAIAALASLAQLGQASQDLTLQGLTIVVNPPCTSPFTPWKYIGCYEDPAGSGQDGHDFDYTVNSIDRNSMTPQKCWDGCKGAGYRYASGEFSGECRCHNIIDVPQLPDSSCNMPCSGDKTQMCGAGNIQSVWEDTTYNTPIADTSIADYEDHGCWTDASNQGRALSRAVPANDKMTVEECKGMCFALGYPYAGTEFTRECYCANNLEDGSTQVPSTSCNMPCGGNSSEICGGSAVLSVYYNPKLTSSQPCGFQPPAPKPSTTSSTPPPPKPTTSSSVYVPPPKPTTTSSVYVPPPKPTTTSSVYVPPPKPTTTSSVYVPPPKPTTTYVPPPPKPTTTSTTPTPTPTPTKSGKSCPPQFKKRFF